MPKKCTPVLFSAPAEIYPKKKEKKKRKKENQINFKSIKGFKTPF